MSEDEQSVDGLSPDEQALERRLAELGGLMAELRRAEDEVASPFARTLRAHLLYGEDLAPHPTFARRLRARLLRPRGARPVHRPRRAPWSWLPVVLAVIALVGVLVAQLPRGASFQTPTPSRADLAFNLLGAPGHGTGLAPTLSLIRRSPAVLFHGPLHLLAPSLSHATHEARAYRLQAHADIAQRVRTRLEISDRVHRVRVDGTAWLLAVDGGTHRHPIHSLALSLSTGQFIYHDRRNYVLPRSARPLSKPAAISVARHWLQLLGWPDESMPVRRVGSVPGHRKVRQVVLGWPHVRRAAVEAATLWVAPNHSVIEASVWPQVVASGTVRTRSARSAWVDVTTHRVPIASLIPKGTTTVLRGQLRHVSSILVIVPGRSHRSYLVPAYLFEGSARSGSLTGAQPWISLAPAQ